MKNKVTTEPSNSSCRSTQPSYVVNITIFAILTCVILMVGYSLSNPKSEYKLPVDFPRTAILPKGLINVEYEYNGDTWTMISTETGTTKEVLSKIKDQLIKRNVQLQHYISMPHGEQCMFVKGQYTYTLEVLKTDVKGKVKVKYAVASN